MKDGAWAPIEDDAVYGVVSNNYMRAGGDGYKVFKTNGKKTLMTMGRTWKMWSPTILPTIRTSKSSFLAVLQKSSKPIRHAFA